MLDDTYRIERPIGRGAMGAVYVAEHLELGKRFAVKVLAPSEATDVESVSRLRNEARITSAIDHENIVNVTHLGQTETGDLFIVMELLEGESLRDRMARQQRSAESADADEQPWLPNDEARVIVEQVLAALTSAHARGVVHRDLKPDNVFLTQRRGRLHAKVLDFGISKTWRGPQADMKLTSTGQLIGTPLYMSPEQSRSTSDVDARADLYSLGIIVYEMLTGRIPFEATNLYEVIVKHATEAPRPPTEIRPGLEPAVEEVVLRCLAKEPDGRFASADDALEAWTRAWGEQSDAEERASEPHSELGPVVSSSSPAETIDAQSHRTGVTGRGRMVLVVATAAVALAALVVFATWPSSTDAPRDGRGAETASPPPAEPGRDDRAPPQGAGRAEAPAAPVQPQTEEGPDADVSAALVRRVVSRPAGATIYVDGRRIGPAPQQVTIPKDVGRVVVEAKRRGYRRARHALTPESPATVEIELEARVEHSAQRRQAQRPEDDYPGLAPR